MPCQRTDKTVFDPGMNLKEIRISAALSLKLPAWLDLILRKNQAECRSIGGGRSELSKH